MTISPTHPFSRLTPGLILDAVEGLGFRSDSRIFPLNSYENRVYQIGLEEGTPLIAKFYRPGRWSMAQIQEEHAFCRELVEHELPVVAPLSIDGETLFTAHGFCFALFPRRGGHAPEFDDLDNLLVLGRFLGRMHRIGAVRPFLHRPTLDSATFGHASVELIATRFIPTVLLASYRAITHDLLQLIDDQLRALAPLRLVRVHGDCHAGNILWRSGAPHFVDFDDARLAPAIQDLWMMLSGERSRQRSQLETLLTGYEEFYPFAQRELPLIEALRTLRMLHYSAWLAARWDDPIFPHTFTWFNTPRYWNEHVLELREQLAALVEPPLTRP